MEIPPYLIDQITRGRVILFLGAGANHGSKDKHGHPAPLGNDLSDRLSDKFLGGGFKDNDLSFVADLSMSESDQNTVEKFISDELLELVPADYHLLIPRFKWRGIVTLNYDKIIETSFSNCKDKLQNVVPILSDSDHIDEVLRDSRLVPLLKIHGCISRTGDSQLPLVLTIDQFIGAGTNRAKLYNLFSSWCSEYTVLIVGSSMKDYDVRQTILNITDDLQRHPTYYYIKPNIHRTELHYWSAKSIEVIKGTFEEFLVSADQQIPDTARVLSVLQEAGHPVRDKYVIDEPVASGVIEAFKTNYVYVSKGMAIENGNPSNFYRGDGLGWFAIKEELDVKRNLLEQILLEGILIQEDDRPTDVELYVIKGEAGAGKSVFLRRLAWETGVSLSRMAIYYQGYSWRGMEDVLDLYRATKERLFLFVDNASDNKYFIGQVLSYCRRMKIKITVVTTERTNEWNTYCEAIQPDVTQEYNLRYLSHEEIVKLVQLLEMHDALGALLSTIPNEEVVELFEEKAGRQLLVALHEVTQGRPFEEILIDEYQSIASDEGRSLYLTVCALNRLKMPVRAGIVSRIHGIVFEEFENRLLKPLERVVIVDKLPWGDYCYKARHPEIANIVFLHVLSDRHDRYDEYVNILNALDPMYSIDEDMIRGMLKAKSIHALFPDYGDARAVYSVAEEKLGQEKYLLQQMANYERIRPDGNLSRAIEYMDIAMRNSPNDDSLRHTLAEIYLRRADQSDNIYERERYRTDANAMLGMIRGRGLDQSYNDVTRAKIAIQKVEDCLSRSDVSEKALKESMREVEKQLLEMKQSYPHNSHVLSCDLLYAELLHDDERCEAVLRNANELNQRDPYIAIRYARTLAEKERHEEAQEVLRIALEVNRSDKRLNYEYAESLRNRRIGTHEELASYYRRAYTDGDGNYLSQFWHARYLYETGGWENKSKAKGIFKKMRELRISPTERVRIRDAFGGLDNPVIYAGTIIKQEMNYCIVRVDRLDDACYTPQSSFSSEEWRAIRRGDNVAVKIGFNMSGVFAFDAHLNK